jgi:hypothetical protein
VGGASGGGGAGGEPSSGCTKPSDCDDEIDCTEDVCVEGECVNTPRTTRCEPDAGECLVCLSGIGCVAGTEVKQQLLIDPNFDEVDPAWEQYSETWDINIFPLGLPDTEPNIASFGPASDVATEQEYADLLQYLVIPTNTTKLTLTGKLWMSISGVVAPEDDYVVAALYDEVNGPRSSSGVLMPSVQFNDWRGTTPEMIDWETFSYDAELSELESVAGREVSFDLVAFTWDSVFDFDTFSLEATSCEEQ